MNIGDINQRLERINHSFVSLKNKNFSQIETSTSVSGDIYSATIDFNGGKTEAELKNSVYLLISNIASIKDHLKAWCLSNSKVFTGDHLIDQDINVSIVHDLWNIDKHPEYNNPRSGFLPKIVNLKQTLLSSVGTGAGYTIFSFDPSTGENKIESGGSGSVDLSINGNIVNERGEIIGNLVDVCNQALLSWEKELRRLGIIK